MYRLSNNTENARENQQRLEFSWCTQTSSGETYDKCNWGGVDTETRVLNNCRRWMAARQRLPAAGVEKCSTYNKPAFTCIYNNCHPWLHTFSSQPEISAVYNSGFRQMAAKCNWPIMAPSCSAHGLGLTVLRDFLFGNKPADHTR